MEFLKVIGFDPGYAITGWGVVESPGAGEFRALGYGAILTDAETRVQDRLAIIFEDTTELLKAHRPERVIVEQLYFSSNRSTAGGVYQARGVILAACGIAGLEILEMGPGRVKQTVTGSGRAGKGEVMRMVQRLIGVREPITPDDTADALAVAISGLIALSSPLTRGTGGAS